MSSIGADPVSRASASPWAQLSLLVLRRWLRRTGIRPALAGTLVAVAVALSGAAGVGVSRSSLAQQLAPLGPAVVVGIVTSVVLAAALLTAVAGCAGADLTADTRSLLYLPVASRALTLYLSAPGMLVAAGLVGLAHPALGALLVALTGYGWVHALGVLAGATLAGVFAGRLLVTGARAATSRSAMLVQHLMTVVVSAWAAVAAGSLWLVRERMASGHVDELGGYAAATGWTTLLALVMRPRLSAVLAVLALLSVLAVAIACSSGSRACVGVTVPPRARALVLWSATARAGDLRLALARMLRHRRTLTWVVTDALVLAGATAFVLRADPASVEAVGANLLLLVALLASYPALLARGLDRKSLPVPVVLGLGPARYTAGWQAASCVVGLALAVAPVTAVALVLHDVGYLVAGLGLTCAALCVAMAFSALVVPRPGDSGAELTGGAVVVVAIVSVGLLVSRVVGAERLGLLAVLEFLLLAPLLALPVLTETRRWHLSTRGEQSSVAAGPLPGRSAFDRILSGAR
jgi:hypothetical protein